MEKKYKILLLIVLIYCILVFIIFSIANINNTIILISPNISIKYDGKNYKKIEFNSKLRYNIYVDNIFDSKNLLAKDENTFYLNNKVINNLIAFSNNKIKVKNYKTEDISKVEIEETLSELNIKKYNDMKIANKILLDYDNDKSLEEINILSNAFVDPFMEDYNDDKFLVVYTKNNNKKNIIYYKKFINDMNACSISNPYFVDINNDNKYEMITTCSYFDKLGIKTQIFELKEDYKLKKEL